MLLETLDIKKNDILIYSQNMFDLENNFKIIYKDDPVKESRKISYGEVCRFVNEYTPKNLIVYRLLTNIPDFEIFVSKYGFFLNVNNVTELIYFDPVFAVKELEEYPESMNYDLRFRIQQVGLTTLNRFKDLPNYAEIYSVDMQADEAKNQNDKVFADAIFAFEKDVKEHKPAAQQPVRKNTENNTVLKKRTNLPENQKQSKASPVIKTGKPASDPHDIRIISHDLSEDKDFDYRQIMKINFKGATSEAAVKKGGKYIVENKIADAQKKARQSSFGKFLQSKQINRESPEHVSLGDVSKDHLTDIFKSPSSLKNLVQGKENPRVVLKLNKK
ncbi:MAG: hypothetical protein R6W90_14145 [Ignavibacteriaceae bacterium]